MTNKVRKVLRSLGIRMQRHEYFFRRNLHGQAPRFTGEPPAFAAINRPLLNRRDLELSLGQCCRLGIPLHGDLPKNWDTLTAVTLTLETCRSRTEAVLDAGATMYSSFLKVLYLYGFRNLVGVNLEFRGERRLGPIRFLPGDITRLLWDDGYFSVVLCQSVIEHGVPQESFFREMARVVRPGGLLVISTDYWEPKLVTTGMEAYGSPVHIFSGAEILAMLKLAQKHGWELECMPALDCEEAVVEWRRFGIRYTFYNMVLRRQRA